MVAVQIVGAGIYSTVSLWLTAIGFLVAGFLAAPAPVRRDRRMIAAVLMLIVVVVIGHRVEAGTVPFQCPYQGTALEWLCYVL